MKLIGLFGQAGSAKDESGRYIIKKLSDINSQWERISFAKPVKDIFCQAFGVNEEFIEKWKRIPEPPPGFSMPVRQSLQFIGDGFRNIRRDVWLDIAINSVERPSVITDGRYLSEAKRIKNIGGTTILLWRKFYENNDPNPSESEIKQVVDYCLNHLDEGIISKNNVPKEIGFFDFFIRNDGTLNDLYVKLDKLLPNILEVCGAEEKL